MVQQYAQTTNQTCLAVALLSLAGVKITKHEEWKTFEYALKFCKEDFTIGHIQYIAQKHKTNFVNYIDNKYYYSHLKKKKLSKKIKLEQKKITLQMINKLIKKSPLIVQIDAWGFWKIDHCSHFVIVLEKNKNGYKVFDPWFGKIFQKSTRELSQGISNLRTALKYCPQAVQVVKPKELLTSLY